MHIQSRQWLSVTAAILSVVIQSTVFAEDNYADVRAAINRLIPGMTEAEIRPSNVPGMLEVRNGTNVFYVSADGEYLLNGPLYTLDGGQNLSEQRVAEYRKTLFDDIAAASPVQYPAEEGRYQLTVVTDIDCPYCRRLHQDLAEYHAAGFDIQYLMLPRSGRNTPSYFKTVNAICASQPAETITAAMSGQEPAPAECEHPIDQHMQMAQALGAVSTPNILLPDGVLIRGYKTAAELTRMLSATSPGPL